MRVTVTDEQIRTAFDAIRGDPSFQESRDLYERGRRPSEMVQAMALRPEILSAFGQLGHGVYPGGLLERSVKELVIIEASRRNACQFCRDSHVAVMRMLGMSDDPLLALENPASLTDRERLAVEYTGMAMEDANRVSDALFDQLREHYSEAEIVELTFLIGFINMLNIFNNCLRVSYADDYVAISQRAAPQGSRLQPRARRHE